MRQGLFQRASLFSPAMLVAVAAAVSLCATTEASVVATATPWTDQAVLVGESSRHAVAQWVGRLHQAARQWLDRKSTEPGPNVPLPVAATAEAWHPAEAFRAGRAPTTPAVESLDTRTRTARADTGGLPPPLR